MANKLNGKSRIDLKRTPHEAQAFLKELSGDDLDFLSSFSSSLKFDSFYKIAKKLIEFEMNKVYDFPEEDPQRLAIFKAGSRGKVHIVSLLAYLFKGSGKELERRSKERK